MPRGSSYLPRGSFVLVVMKQIVAKISSWFAARRRERLLKMVINSGLVDGQTEAQTAIRITDEVMRYIDTGECDGDSLPNGFRYEAMP